MWRRPAAAAAATAAPRPITAGRCCSWQGMQRAASCSGRYACGPLVMPAAEPHTRCKQRRAAPGDPLRHHQHSQPLRACSPAAEQCRAAGHLPAGPAAAGGVRAGCRQARAVRHAAAPGGARLRCGGGAACRSANAKAAFRPRAHAPAHLADAPLRPPPLALRPADVAASIAQCGGIQVLVGELTAAAPERRAASCHSLYFLGWQGAGIRWV